MSGAPDQPDPLAGKIVVALDLLARARRTQRQATATHHGLTPLQLDLLAALADGPPPEPRVGMLATEVGVAQPTVTDSLNTLAGKGLVERRRADRGARQVAVGLTTEGRRVAEAARTDDGTAAVLAGLSPADQRAVFESLLTLIARLADAGAIDVARTCPTCRYHRHDGRTHRCALLDIDLAVADLRVNCPDHQTAS
ncbi:MAG TPA: MarR family winged helix-turn-helix transcriptional regulator [Ilumatobacter sp.]|nr:MarR family winged helix-turn-helix transcriptional regulator [Ilumatobacter sp.]